jgi:hypothetical protein
MGAENSLYPWRYNVEEGSLLEVEGEAWRYKAEREGISSLNALAHAPLVQGRKEQRSGCKDKVRWSGVDNSF